MDCLKMKICGNLTISNNFGQNVIFWGGGESFAAQEIALFGNIQAQDLEAL
jgi:hypothetical protein